MPKIPPGQERRRLNRLQTEHTGSFHVVVKYLENEMKCSVSDFHSEGLLLKLSPDQMTKIEGLGQFEQIDFYYGAKVIGRLIGCEIRRSPKKGYIGISVPKVLPRKGSRNETRFKTRRLMQPTVSCKNPISIDDVFNFIVIDVSISGLQLECSLSNKSIMPGLELKNASITLPTLGQFQVDIKIIRVKYNEGYLTIGAEFQKIPTTFMENLIRFLLLGAPTDDAQETLNLVKKHKLKKISPAIRIQYLSSLAEYRDIVHVRYASYLAAKKTDGTLGEESMGDEFDARSLIFVARVQGKVVGTARIVFSKDRHEAFPFESYLKFSDLFENIQRDSLCEISRLAVLPDYQDTDLVLKILQHVSKEVVVLKKTALCLATTVAQKNYTKIGWTAISESFPHPFLNQETMQLLQIDWKGFISGKKMYGTAWKRIAKDVVVHLNEAGTINISPMTYRKDIQAWFEELATNAIKRTKKYLARTK